MVTPPSTLARNASESNLDFDAFATTESVHASVRLDYRKTGAVTASLSIMVGTEPKQLGHTPAALLRPLPECASYEVCCNKARPRNSRRALSGSRAPAPRDRARDHKSQCAGRID